MERIQATASQRAALISIGIAHGDAGPKFTKNGVQ